MTLLYKRNVAVNVGTLRVESTAEKPGLQIEFRVTRSIDITCNRAEVSITNLSKTSQAKCAVRDAVFSIEAGYGDSIGLIFRGRSVNGATRKESMGFTTTIEAADGFTPMRARVAKSLAPGVTANQVLEEIAKAMGLQLTKSPALGGAFANGVSMNGAARDELNKLAKSMRFEWSIQNETLQVLLPDAATTDTAVLLNQKTGLVADGPARIYDKERPKKFIVKGKSLLQASIMPGRKIAIESGEVTGHFRCEKVDHAGCSRGGDFYSEFEAVAL